jgi:hypothetical protein
MNKAQQRYFLQWWNRHAGFDGFPKTHYATEALEELIEGVLNVGLSVQMSTVPSHNNSNDGSYQKWVNHTKEGITMTHEVRAIVEKKWNEFIGACVVGGPMTIRLTEPAIIFYRRELDDFIAEVEAAVLAKQQGSWPTVTMTRKEMIEIYSAYPAHPTPTAGMPSDVSRIAENWWAGLPYAAMKKMYHGDILHLAFEVESAVRAECQAAQPRMTDEDIKNISVREIEESTNDGINPHEDPAIYGYRVARTIRDFYERRPL